MHMILQLIAFENFLLLRNETRTEHASGKVQYEKGLCNYSPNIREISQDGLKANILKRLHVHLCKYFYDLFSL